MLEYTLKELIVGLETNQWSSVDLVNMYTDQIKKYNKKLNAVAEMNPDAIHFAKRLDHERKENRLRSILHGIPILIKDNINTNDQMHTTANSLALNDLIAPYDATIVKKLISAGVIILGKANLSEFAYFMSYDEMPSGYGSRNGQVVNPYNDKIDPLGSSTGSAVAVAANMIPVSIGTETNGSLMAPAYQNSIVSIKPTFGLVSRYGIIPISETQDMAGPMARNVEDCSLLLSVMIGTDTLDKYTVVSQFIPFDFIHAVNIPANKKKIAIIHLNHNPYNAEEISILEDAKSKLSKKGYSIDDIVFEDSPIKNDQSLLYEFKNGINEYLKSVRGYTKMNSLNEIIEFNKMNSEKCLKYGQSILISAENTSGDLNDPKYIDIRKELLHEANRIEELMIENNYEAVLSTKWLSYAPIAGNPSICVPAKKLTDLTPISIVFVGRKWHDDILISIAHAYEQVTKYRIPPQVSI